MKIRIAALLVLLPCLPASSQAAEAPCDAWFPDFHCDRSGRFAGFHKPIVAPTTSTGSPRHWASTSR